MTHTSHDSHKQRRQQPQQPQQPSYVGIRGYNYPTTGYLPMPCQSDVTANANTDSTPTHLHEAHEHTLAAIAHLEAIRADSRIDPACCDAALDALRDALTAIEAEAEAGYAD